MYMVFEALKTDKDQLGSADRGPRTKVWDSLTFRSQEDDTPETNRK